MNFIAVELVVIAIYSTMRWRCARVARGLGARGGRVAGTPIGEIPSTIDGAPAIYRGDLVDRVPRGYGLPPPHPQIVASDAAAHATATADRYEGDFFPGKIRRLRRLRAGRRLYASRPLYWGGGGKRHGCGTCKWSTGDQYEGATADGIMHMAQRRAIRGRLRKRQEARPRRLHAARWRPIQVRSRKRRATWPRDYLPSRWGAHERLMGCRRVRWRHGGGGARRSEQPCAPVQSMRLSVPARRCSPVG